MGLNSQISWRSANSSPLVFRFCGVELNDNGLLQVESQPADYLLTLDFYSDAENELTGFQCYLSGQSKVGLTTPAPPPGATWGPEIGKLKPGERACGIRNVNALNANATGKEEGEDRIVNGWETAKHEYPWQVLKNRPVSTDKIARGLFWICTGSCKKPCNVQ